MDEAIIELVLKVLSEQYAAKRPEIRIWHEQGTLDSLLERKRLLKEAYNAGTIQPADFFQMLPDLEGQIQESESDRAAFLGEQEARNFLAVSHASVGSSSTCDR
ncbi:hypothetical protein ABZX65_22505 [Streptomyces sp. NPDC003300]|uniref:hypothetical protein n=1 Tax=unclassified Streptomyces TaxID=2593676 RepID=UPI0033A82B8E